MVLIWAVQLIRADVLFRFCGAPFSNRVGVTRSTLELNSKFSFEKVDQTLELYRAFEKVFFVC